jgi:UDP-2-acetamido-3-amino-2,3-dideoxy-glucuronate N-acetyltransferase
MDNQKAIALIGAGYWGKNLVRNLHELTVLKTVCDASTAIRKQITETYPDISVTDDLDAILNDPDIQGVVISVPAALHFDLATRALTAGKHVFVEKPLALTYRDGSNLVNLAKDKQKILFVGHILHYHPAIVRMKAMIDRGELGRLQYIYSRRLSLGKIRREENILWSFAPHDISVILGITGEEPCYVDAVGSNFLHAQIPDVTVSNLKFPSGIGAHIFVSWLNPFKEQRLVVIGSQGMMVFDDTQPIKAKLTYYPNQITWKNGIPVSEKAEGNTIDLTEAWEEPLKAECRAFLHAIAHNEPPLTAGEEGLRVLKILEICQSSLEANERNEPQMLFPHEEKEAQGLVFGKPNHYVDKTAIIDEGVRIGNGTKIWHFSHMLSNSNIGENCNIGQNVVIGPDVTVGDGCKIQNNVCVYKGITLEDGVFCGPSMVFTNIYNPRAEIPKMDQLRATLVKKGATLGANCTIVCGHTIGRYAFVAAGAVVTRDVPDHALVLGNPARRMGWMCECGEKLGDDLLCPVCGRIYRQSENGLSRES